MMMSGSWSYDENNDSNNNYGDDNDSFFFNITIQII